MIIFLYGSDGYRLKENVDTIVGAYRKKHESGISYYRFDFSDRYLINHTIAGFVRQGGFESLANAVKTVSFFDEARLIVIKNIFSGGLRLAKGGYSYFGELKALIDDFKITNDRKTILVFVENKAENDLKKTDKNLFIFLSSQNNLVRSIGYLTGAKLTSWVKSKFKENGHHVPSVVADCLISAVGNESWALANEVNKLSNYKKSGTVTEKDIDLLVNRKEDSKIFDLVDAVGNQNKAKAFEMMYRLTNSGHDPHYLLSMLVYHFENLLSVSDMLSRSLAAGSGDIAKKCGLHPFVARKAASQASRFSKEDLLSKFNRLAELDVASKNGQVNLEDALYNFVVS